jgi:hypothetical protein
MQARVRGSRPLAPFRGVIMCDAAEMVCDATSVLCDVTSVLCDVARMLCKLPVLCVAASAV